MAHFSLCLNHSRTLLLYVVCVDQTGVHSFLQRVVCQAQATLPPPSSGPASPSPSSCSLAHRHEVLRTCISDLLCVGGLDDQLSDCANCAATFLQCQVLSEEVGGCDCHMTIMWLLHDYHVIVTLLSCDCLMTLYRSARHSRKTCFCCLVMDN